MGDQAHFWDFLKPEIMRELDQIYFDIVFFIKREIDYQQISRVRCNYISPFVENLKDLNVFYCFQCFNDPMCCFKSLINSDRI